MRRLQKNVGREKESVDNNPENKWVGIRQVGLFPRVMETNIHDDTSDIYHLDKMVELQT